MSARRIFVIATDSAGCYWYRLHLPLTHLDPERFEIVWRGPDIAELREGDIVIGQRLADDNAAWRQIGAMDGVTAVYDWDDDLLHVDQGNAVPYSLYGQSHVQDQIKANLAAANVVTCSTRALAEMTSEFNPNTVVLENCIQRVRGLPNPEHHWGTPIRIGWAGSPFHAQDWFGSDVAALRQIKAEYGDRVEFATIGADYMGGVSQRHTGWTNMGSYLSAMDFCIGIAPLADTPFNSRKSWIKALEYMSCGVIPVVPTIGQYPELIDSGRNGLTYWPAEPDMNPLAWTLDWLLRHDGERPDMGERALQTAAQWTIDKQAHRWAETYEREW